MLKLCRSGEGRQVFHLPEAHLALEEVLSIGHDDDHHDDARTKSTGTNSVHVQSSPPSLSPTTWIPTGPDLNMTTDDTNKRSDSRDLRGNLGDDHGRLTGGHPKANASQPGGASSQKADIEAQPILPPCDSQSCKSKTRPPSPGKRLFTGKSSPPDHRNSSTQRPNLTRFSPSP
jgi:hypothetical protein